MVAVGHRLVRFLPVLATGRGFVFVDLFDVQQSCCAFVHVSLVAVHQRAGLAGRDGCDGRDGRGGRGGCGSSMQNVAAIAPPPASDVGRSRTGSDVFDGCWYMLTFRAVGFRWWGTVLCRVRRAAISRLVMILACTPPMGGGLLSQGACRRVGYFLPSRCFSRRLAATIRDAPSAISRPPSVCCRSVRSGAAFSGPGVCVSSRRALRFCRSLPPSFCS